MVSKRRIGIYFCGPFNFDTNSFDLNDLISFSSQLSHVAFVKDSRKKSKLHPKQVLKEIQKYQLDRIIVAGIDPGFYKTLFTYSLTQSGGKASEVFLARFNTYDSLKKIRAVLACAVNDVPFEVAATPVEADIVSENTLIIGGGIAGIQAALEIANAGYKVYLVEKSGTIGGHMAMFDKTFPTLDCAACILTPKMVDVGQHPNIELITFSEVMEVSGDVGNFGVKILKKARRVDLATCIACGICAEKCPGNILNEFDAGISYRKAIHIPFPQAVPNKYLIDPNACFNVRKGTCRACVKRCPTGAINLDEKDSEVEIKVGNIIVAVGFEIFDVKRAEQFGYGKYPNVVNPLQFERIVNASGPTGGNIRLQTQNKKGEWIFGEEGDIPSSIAIIHCVGSRDHNYFKHCSRVCCMYSLKFAHLIKEKLPHAEVFEYYIDMRAFGKGYEEFYQRIINEGVNVIRGRTAKVEKVNNKLRLRSEDVIRSELIEQEVDMVVLSAGIGPRENSKELAQLLNIQTGSEGWFSELGHNVASIETQKSGIFLAGVCQGPKDIPDSVAQGQAAAARVLQSIGKGKVSKTMNDLTVQEIESQARRESE